MKTVTERLQELKEKAVIKQLPFEEELERLALYLSINKSEKAENKLRLLNLIKKFNEDFCKGKIKYSRKFNKMDEEDADMLNQRSETPKSHYIYFFEVEPFSEEDYKAMVFESYDNYLIIK